MKSLKLLILILLIIPFFPVNASADKVSGLVLLQAEDLGQLWYVNPDNLEKYYMRNNDDVFKLMKYSGLDITEAAYKSFNSVAPKRLAGRILLRVQANGEAYYVNPRTLNIHFLGRPHEAFKFMASLSVGAKNSIIDPIKINQDFEEPAAVIAEEVSDDSQNEPVVEEEEVIENIEEDASASTTEESAPQEATTSDECVFLEELFSNKLLLGTPSATTTTSAIDYDWGLSAPEGLAIPNKFSARWTGRCYFEGGLYKFSSSYNDAISIFIDGSNFIRSWRDSNITVNNNQEKNIEAGYHDIKVEYYDDSGWANVKFSWEKIGELSY